MQQMQKGISRFRYPKRNSNEDTSQRRRASEAVQRMPDGLDRVVGEEGGQIVTQCKDCKFIRKLYVPPIDAYKDIPKDAFVCNLFEQEDNRVTYMNSDTEMCECFSRR